VVLDFLKSIQALSLSQTVRKSLWVFPALECIHIYSMIFLVTVVATFDMRLMGFKIVGEAQPLPKLAKLALVLGSICFGVNLVTGLLLFMSHGPDYFVNSAFLIKMVLVLSAVAYHLWLFSRASKWGDAPAHTVRSRFTGLASLVLWVGVIAASRWIAFV
jgi:hypothetical protein